MPSDRIDPRSVRIEVFDKGVAKGQTGFTVTHAGCTGVLRYDAVSNSLNFTTVRDSLSLSGCKIPIEQDVVMLHPLLDRFFGQLAQNSYSFAMAGYHEMYSRLIIAASASPTWDVKRGRPLKGTTAAFLVALLNSADTYPELVSLFHDYGYSIRVTDVEDILVVPYKPVDFIGDRILKDAPIRSGKYPSSAAVYFKIDKY